MLVSVISSYSDMVAPQRDMPGRPGQLPVHWLPLISWGTWADALNT